MAEVTDIGQIQLSRILINVTYHDPDIWPNRILGAANPSDINLELNFVHEQYDALNKIWDDEVPRWFRVLLRPTWNMQVGQKYWQIVMQALIAEVSLTAALEDRVMANISLAARGKIEYSEIEFA